ncbi:hypothetical protein BaRGS_00018466 [Batillaria attramentaria]|uniref:Uncharacterized protein n=1 Tax=Batillaria attramentaria TaxID=370345 RepID=A0ABD0KSZ7_9CAEN
MGFPTMDSHLERLELCCRCRIHSLHKNILLTQTSRILHLILTARKTAKTCRYLMNLPQRHLHMQHENHQHLKFEKLASSSATAKLDAMASFQPKDYALTKKTANKARDWGI